MLLAQCEDMMSAMGKAFYTNNKAEEMPKFFAEKVPSDLEKLEKLVSGGVFLRAGRSCFIVVVSPVRILFRR